MIVIGMGANLPSERYGSPVETLEAALTALDGYNAVRVTRRSRWFESAPVPISDQPWYINGACLVDTELEAQELLSVLHEIESNFGRVRSEKNAPRVLDLDLLVYHDLVTSDDQDYTVPHPRMHERGFVLLPMMDLVPGWLHPILSSDLKTLINNLSIDQVTRPLEQVYQDADAEYDDPLLL
ncbi:MAG: 2-amino-4-hydroxy-6-hydroxymethyldihydropteridine diphosphokinase [Magnetovibrio sp.]|nr:2-amino-4-hydroxy-6-hydroxymethyldihydropteridine diphosphokinase [Magnetovibrio sp.]